MMNNMTVKVRHVNNRDMTIKQKPVISRDMTTKPKPVNNRDITATQKPGNTNRKKIRRRHNINIETASKTKGMATKTNGVKVKGKAAKSTDMTTETNGTKIRGNTVKTKGISTIEVTEVHHDSQNRNSLEAGRNR